MAVFTVSESRSAESSIEQEEGTRWTAAVYNLKSFQS